MKKVCILALYFMLFCLVFIRFNGQNYQKPTENEVKVEEDIPPSEKVESEVVEEIIEEEPKQYVQYRLTSFWNNDGYGTSACTGSGLCEDDFQINNKGWYTYNGKLVLAAATYECLNAKSGACGKWNVARSDKTYYHYRDTIELIIDGIEYEGIILDSCGACMYVNNEQRIDLFVSGKSSSIDRGYRGNNTISVFKEVE